MNAMKWKRWINCLLAITLFFSGMCFESIKTDSSISYTVNPTKTCSYHLSQDTNNHQDICTNEQLRTSTLRGTVETLNRNSFSNKGKSRMRTGFFLSTLNVLSENSNFSFNDVYTRLYRTCIPCEAVIISYIHHQDGAKG